MRRVICEIITLIRIERWLVADDAQGTVEQAGVSECVLEQIVLTEAEEAYVRELFRRILEERQRNETRTDTTAEPT